MDHGVCDDHFSQRYVIHDTKRTDGRRFNEWRTAQDAVNPRICFGRVPPRLDVDYHLLSTSVQTQSLPAVGYVENGKAVRCSGSMRRSITYVTVRVRRAGRRRSVLGIASHARDPPRKPRLSAHRPDRRHGDVIGHRASSRVVYRLSLIEISVTKTITERK